MPEKVMPKDKGYSFTLSRKDLQAETLTSSGAAYDVLALAAKLDEYNDVTEYVEDAKHEGVKYRLEQYDFESAYISTLNAAGNDYAKIKTLTGDRVSSPGLQRAEEAKLLFGAWYALNMPEMFAESLDEWTEKVKEECREYWNESPEVPADLLKEIMDTIDEIEREQFREFLHGDYRDFRGVYAEAQRRLFNNEGPCNDVDLSPLAKGKEYDAVLVTMEEDDGRQLVADYEGADLKRPRISEKRVKAAVLGTIVHAAQATISKRTADRDRRRNEWKEQEERRKERDATDNEERTKKLLSMTR